MTAGNVGVPTIIPLRPPVPGKPKLKIDDETPIEITTENKDADIYFTLDGNKPDILPSVGSKLSTYIYKKPFKLKPGKFTVKAVAAVKDKTRESSTVSKTFHIEHNPSVPNAGKQFDNLQFLTSNLYGSSETITLREDKNPNQLVKPRLPSKESWTKLEDQLIGLNKTVSGKLLKKADNAFEHKSAINLRSASRKSLLDDILHTGSGISLGSSLGKSEVNSDFWTCHVCHSARAADPNARYCHECGSAVPPLPSSHLPPTHSGQMSICSNCYSMIPLNLTSCVVCENSLDNIEKQTIANGFTIKEKLICSICKTPNPLNIQSCLFCESNLKNAKLEVAKYQDTTDTYSAEKYVTCTKCRRSNPVSRARCLQCHERLNYQTSHHSIECDTCQTKNHAYARYCSNCGMILTSDVLGSSTSNITSLQPRDEAPPNIPRTAFLSSPEVRIPLHITKTRNQSTQTSGLFDMSRYVGGSRPDSSASTTSQRAVVAGAASAGRGYWRQQVDHITAHLKSYIQGDATFRARIGAPRIGKLITASVREDDEVVKISLTFNHLDHDDDDVRRRRIGGSSNLSSADTLSTASSTSLESVVEVGKTDKSKSRKIRVRAEHGGSEESRMLIEEICSEKSVDLEKLDRLIDEGADVNCRDSHGIPAIALAVQYRQSDVVDKLVEAGAKVNIMYGSIGNTPLHDAVKLGPAYTDIINILLKYGSKVDARNKQGITPNDLAAKAGYTGILQSFATQLGHAMIKKMIK